MRTKKKLKFTKTKSGSEKRRCPTPAGRSEQALQRRPDMVAAHFRASNLADPFASQKRKAKKR
jgi:hypothetical protein